MARLTPNDILKLSEPVELVYQQIVDALLLNIARHFNTGKALSTQEWQMKKLAELGQLNKESLAIIADMTGQIPELIQISLESAALEATKDIEPELQETVKKGVIKGASADTVLTSRSISNAMNRLRRTGCGKVQPCQHGHAQQYARAIPQGDREYSAARTAAEVYAADPQYCGR